MTLQDILNTINRSINNSGSGSGSNRSSQKLKLNARLIGGILFLLVLIVGGLTSFFMVDQTEEAVVLRLGEYNRTMGAGLHFKLPFRVEHNYNIPTGIIQNQTFGFRTLKPGIISQRASGDYSKESMMLTGDLNIVNVEWIIQYRITDPRAWLFNVQTPNTTIRDISISVVNQLVGDYYITDVLGDARTEIEEDALTLMNNFSDEYNLGITVSAVRLQNIVPPEGKVQDAFEDVNKAVQDMNRLINEGREEYNKQIPKSRGEAEQMLQIAKGYATERVNEARGDVARFSAVLQEYQRSPRVTRDRLYYEAIENILAKTDTTGNTTFIDGEFENLIPFLPLSNNPTGQTQIQ